ncbi:MAG: LysR family transcriptional regulator [Pseudomonadota bacterium]
MVFLGIMRHGQATAVARDMGLTQPAVSHALKRLRALYDDPLFLRRAHGLEPTARARELEPNVQRILDLMSDTITDRTTFDPSETVAELKIGAFDFEVSTIIADLIITLRSGGSKTNIHAYPLANHEGLDALKSGQIDMAVGYFDFPPKTSTDFIAERLFTEHYVVAARTGHPLLRAEITASDYANAGHVLISPYGSKPTITDHALRRYRLQRNVVAAVPSLVAALAIVAASDLLVTLPSRAAERYVHHFDFAHRPLPIEVGNFDLHVVRHARDRKNSIHTWVLKRLRELVTK